MYGKLIDNVIEYAPSSMDEAELIALGYRPIIRDERPTVDEGWSVMPGAFIERADGIHITWDTYEDHEENEEEQNDHERIAVLEEELRAAKILLGLEE